MDRRGAELKVGIAVIFALVVLVGGIIWIKGFKIASQSYPVRIAFDEVGGLGTGDPVTVQGVTKGSVKNIELGRALVYVDISMDKSIVITNDTQFVIRNIGLMGEKYVAVKLGKSQQKVREGQILRGAYESGIPEVVGELGVALKEFERTVSTVRNAVEEIETEGEVKATFGDLRAFSSEMRGTIEENRDNLRAAIEDMRYASGKLKEFAQVRGPEIDNMVSRLTTTSESIEELVGQLEKLSNSMELVLRKVERGEGSLGKLVNDESLHREMTATLEDTRALIADIKLHPKRYLKVSIF
ncbi:MAG: MlaD family protein [Candidatus Eisenbacteria bacterium]|nr:MlaD family protein [Candidatus Eisenbacteria bacterium]